MTAIRIKSFLSLILVLLLIVTASASEKLVPPTFKVGEWVSYDMTKAVDGGSKQSMKAKYSVVGEEKFEGQDCLWHEVQFNAGGDMNTVFRVLLPKTEPVAAETMLCYISAIANVGDAKRYIIWSPGAQPTEAEMGVINSVSDDLTKKGMRKGFAQDEAIKSLDEMKRKETGVVVKTAGKEFKCDHFVADLKSEISKNRKWSYQVWRCADIPVFGFAKIRYEKVLFGRSELTELTLSGFGTSGAKSVVPGQPIKANMRLGKGPTAPESN
ncbi:MAG: hypothetical protein JW941_06710 [Candidatus Coatesbacteria bacterium]|nr:hypothetical protein [Candidatus Coatesbacteria bacterium]